MTTTSQTGAGRRVLALAFFAAVIEGFDLQAAGVAAPKLVPAFNLGPEQAGLFFSSATLGLILGAFSGGVIADRLGRRAGLIISLAVFGVFSITTAWAASFEQLFILRFLTGVGLGGALPNIIAISAEAVPVEKRGRAVAFVYAGVPLGGATVSLVAMAGLHNDWQSIFIIGGVLPLLLIVPLWHYLPPLHIQRNPAQLGKSRVGALFAQGTLMATALLWIAALFAAISMYIMLNWLPQLLVSLGFERSQSSVVQFAFGLGGTAGALIGGRILDGRQSGYASALLFMVLAASLVGLGLLPAGMLGLAIMAGAMLGAGLLASQALLIGLAPQIYPAEVRGTGVGLSVAVGRIGAVVGPLLAGALLASGGGPTDVIYATLPILLICALSTIILIIRQRRTFLVLA